MKIRTLKYKDPNAIKFLIKDQVLKIRTLLEAVHWIKLLHVEVFSKIGLKLLRIG